MIFEYRKSKMNESNIDNVLIFDLLLKVSLSIGLE